jgi:hypothetical protein
MAAGYIRWLLSAWLRYHPVHRGGIRYPLQLFVPDMLWMAARSILP